MAGRFWGCILIIPFLGEYPFHAWLLLNSTAFGVSVSIKSSFLKCFEVSTPSSHRAIKRPGSLSSWQRFCSSTRRQILPEIDTATSSKTAKADAQYVYVLFGL